MRKIVLGLIATIAALPMLAAPAQAKVYKEWVGKDGKHYCRKSNGTIGVIAGGVAGVLVGRAIDTQGDRTPGTLIGAAAGALAGREIDRKISTKECK